MKFWEPAPTTTIARLTTEQREFLQELIEEKLKEAKEEVEALEKLQGALRFTSAPMSYIVPRGADGVEIYGVSGTRPMEAASISTRKCNQCGNWLFNGEECSTCVTA